MEKIDIVYVLGHGSKHSDSELRYSIRSVVKHVKNMRRIIIVGACPQFIKGVIHLPCKDTEPIPDLNIRNKILAACNSDVVSEDFLFMNDDHFLLKQYDATKFPNYHKGDLKESIEPRSQDSYRIRLTNTYNQLKKKGLGTLNFDTHTPIIYNKKKFIQMTKMFDWTVFEGLVIKSLYGNVNELESELMRDFKINSPSQIKDETRIFSTFPAIGKDMQKYFQDTYSKPSEFEY